MPRFGGHMKQLMFVTTVALVLLLLSLATAAFTQQVPAAVISDPPPTQQIPRGMGWSKRLVELPAATSTGEHDLRDRVRHAVNSRRSASTSSRRRTLSASNLVPASDFIMASASASLHASL